MSGIYVAPTTSFDTDRWGCISEASDFVAFAKSTDAPKVRPYLFRKVLFSSLAARKKIRT
jgi:hypothetical protein